MLTDVQTPLLGTPLVPLKRWERETTRWGRPGFAGWDAAPRLRRHSLAPDPLRGSVFEDLPRKTYIITHICLLSTCQQYNNYVTFAAPLFTLPM